MTLRVDQTLTCDVCAQGIASLTQDVQPGCAVQEIVREFRGPSASLGDLCKSCYLDVAEALYVVRLKKDLERGR